MNKEPWIQLISKKGKPIFMKASFIEFVSPMTVKDELQKKEPVIGSIIITSDGQSYTILDHASDILKWLDVQIVNVAKLDKPFE